MMRRTATVFLLIALALAAAVGAHAEDRDLWSKTVARIGLPGLWQHQVQVTIVPLTARALLAKCDVPGADKAGLSQAWVNELKRLGADKHYLFAVRVARANPQIPSSLELANLIKSPLLIVGATRMTGRTVEPFSHDTLASAQFDQAIIAFDRQKGIFGEYIGSDIDEFEVRLVNPDNLFDFAEWIEADFDLPLTYPHELQELYAELSPGVLKSFLTSF